MIRLLVTGLSNTASGTRSVIMNWYHSIDRNRLQFDFLVRHDFDQPELEKEIEELGGRIYKEQYTRREKPFKFTADLLHFFKQHPEINGVHMNLNHHGYILPLVLAEKLDLPIRIAFSHNSGNTRENEKHFISAVTNSYRKRKLKKLHIFRMACSRIAGEYMFGEGSSVHILHNGIDVKKYLYSTQERKKIRKQLQIQDEDLLFGFVGRMQYQKNPIFMLQIFEACQKMHGNSKLVIIGTGELMEECRKYVVARQLEQKVLFLGFVSDVYNYYSAIDVLLLPSRFEGLAVTAVEAQAAGLSVYASTAISSEHNIVSLVKFISLDSSPTEWAKIILSDRREVDRMSKNNEMINAGYDIKDTSKWLEDYCVSEYMRKR